MPQSLTPLYCDLVSGNPAGRPNPSQVVERGRQSGGFFHNNLIQSLLFVEEIQIKGRYQKQTCLDLPGMGISTFGLRSLRVLRLHSKSKADLYFMQNVPNVELPWKSQAKTKFDSILSNIVVG